MEEGMWAAVRRHLLIKRAAGVAAAGSCGLWKVQQYGPTCPHLPYLQSIDTAVSPCGGKVTAASALGAEGRYT